MQDERGRLVAVVAKVDPDRQSRRLLVLLLEDAATGPGFARAAQEIGLNPVIENWQANLWRATVEPRTLTDAGVPLAIGDIEHLRAFGAHPAVEEVTGGAPSPRIWLVTGTAISMPRSLMRWAVVVSYWWLETRLP